MITTKSSLRKTCLIWLLVPTSFQGASVDTDLRHHRSSPTISAVHDQMQIGKSPVAGMTPQQGGDYVCMSVLALSWHSTTGCLRSEYLHYTETKSARIFWDEKCSQQNFTRVVSLGHEPDNQYLRIYSCLLPLSPMHQGTLTPPSLWCSNFAVSSASHADF